MGRAVNEKEGLLDQTRRYRRNVTKAAPAVNPMPATNSQGSTLSVSAQSTQATNRSRRIDARKVFQRVGDVGVRH